MTRSKWQSRVFTELAPRLRAAFFSPQGRFSGLQKMKSSRLLKKNSLTLWFGIVACLWVAACGASGGFLCVGPHSHFMMAPCSAADCHPDATHDTPASSRTELPRVQNGLEASAQCCACSDIQFSASFIQPRSADAFLQLVSPDHEPPAVFSRGLTSTPIHSACPFPSGEHPPARSPVLASLASVILLI